MTDHRNEPAYENGHDPLLAVKELFGSFQISLVQQKILSDFQDYWLAAIVPHPIREGRSDDGPEAGDGDRKSEIPPAIGDLESDERHHCLARHRGDHALQTHQESSAGVAGRIENLDRYLRNFFGNHPERAARVTKGRAPVQRDSPG